MRSVATASSGLRLVGDEYAPWAGIKPEDAAEIAGLLAVDGAIDFISVTSGSIYSGSPDPARPLRAARASPRIWRRVIKAAVTRAGVRARQHRRSGRWRPAWCAQGQADAVEMTRALIADPELPAKIRDGDPAAVRPCVLSNQDNIIGLVQNPRLSCVNNPAAGYEGTPEFAPLTRAPVHYRVMVVGAGPAGLEAARVAALRGHAVTIYEQERAARRRAAAGGEGTGTGAAGAGGRLAGSPGAQAQRHHPDRASRSRPSRSNAKRPTR